MIERIALKPCPFCGSDAHMRGTLLDERWGYAGVHEITCDDCEASIKKIDRQRHGDYPEPTSKPEAIAASNNRTTELSAGDGVQECDAQFTKAVWDALKGDHNDLRREATILRAHRDARTLAAAAERARIAAGVRACELSSAIPDDPSQIIRDIADAIEAGEV